MFKFSFIKGILIISLMAVVALPVYTVFFASPAFTGLIAENTENEAARVATHLSYMLIKEGTILERGGLPPDFATEAELARGDFKIMKLKLFSPSGEVIYSTDPEDVGKINRKSHFQETVARGNIYTKVVEKGAETMEGQKVSGDVVETYLPIMRNGKFLGAFEIYYDITDRKGRQDAIVTRSYTVLTLITMGLLAAVVISSYREGRAIAAHLVAQEQIVKQSFELRERNTELSVLQDVSSAISRTVGMGELFSIVLDTITKVELFHLERKGGIMLVDGDRMRIASHLGHSDAFLKLHEDMRVGDCLCGLAAKTGGIVVSGNSETDERHTIVCPDAVPHGHIIVPLNAKGRLVGVLYLYTSPDADVDESRLQLLSAIGNQIGIAIDNANLYEETKELSLRDPLTGLANRRMMDIELERNLSHAERHEKALSAIMLDIDHFKKYNDKYGHSAGDRLLADIANVISEDRRASDFVARYGGEEFFILLPETEQANAYIVAERIREKVCAKTDVTMSLGVSVYKKGMRKQDLIDRADRALYEAKQNGRNRTEMDV